jgi:hypothetical protein
MQKCGKNFWGDLHLRNLKFPVCNSNFGLLFVSVMKNWTCQRKCDFGWWLSWELLVMYFNPPRPGNHQLQ